MGKVHMIGDARDPGPCRQCRDRVNGVIKEVRGPEQVSDCFFPYHWCHEYLLFASVEFLTVSRFSFLFHVV